MMEKERVYLAIDLKSFYASVKCVERQLDPMNTKQVILSKLTYRKFMRNQKPLILQFFYLHLHFAKRCVQFYYGIFHICLPAII